MDVSEIRSYAKKANEFWIAAGSKKWFMKSDEFDTDIRANFLTAIEAFEKLDLVAVSKEMDDAGELLGLIIILDQFRRNIFRNDGRAFAQDPIALALSKEVIARKMDDELPKELKMFAYMPFMHSEDLAEQEMSLKLFDNSDYAVIHYDLIKEFGRFPHRNECLGRASTEAEIAFLNTDGFKG